MVCAVYITSASDIFSSKYKTECAWELDTPLYILLLVLIELEDKKLLNSDFCKYSTKTVYCALTRD